MFYAEYPVGGELEMRCTRQCGYCDNVHTEIRKVAPGGELPKEWDLPPGWSLLNGKYICDRHEIEVRDKTKVVTVRCAGCGKPFECTWDQYRKGRKYDSEMCREGAMKLKAEEKAKEALS